MTTLRMWACQISLDRSLSETGGQTCILTSQTRDVTGRPPLRLPNSGFATPSAYYRSLVELEVQACVRDCASRVTCRTQTLIMGTRIARATVATTIAKNRTFAAPLAPVGKIEVFWKAVKRTNSSPIVAGTIIAGKPPGRIDAT